MQSKSPRDGACIQYVGSLDKTIIIALENRNDHVNLGAAILVWVSASEKPYNACAPGEDGRETSRQHCS